MPEETISLQDKMTAKRIVEEYGISLPTVYEMFKDPEMPTQTYTKPHFVLRCDLIKYFSKRHDNLKEETRI